LIAHIITLLILLIFVYYIKFPVFSSSDANVLWIRYLSNELYFTAYSSSYHSNLYLPGKGEGRKNALVSYKLTVIQPLGVQ